MEISGDEIIQQYQLDKVNLRNTLNYWQRKENLNKNEFMVMVECYRKCHQFYNGITNVRMLITLTPSAAKPAVKLGLIVVNGQESPKVLNWYGLTQKGIEVLNRLDLTWKPKYNLPLFEYQY